MPRRKASTESIIIAKNIRMSTIWERDHDKIVENILAKLKKKYEKQEAKRQRRLDRVRLIKKLRAEGFTLEQIGDELGITRERVRQLALLES